MMLCCLLHHLCAVSNWDGHHGLLATFLDQGTVAWERGVFQMKVLPSPGGPGLCCMGCQGNRLFGC